VPAHGRPREKRRRTDEDCGVCACARAGLKSAQETKALSAAAAKERTESAKQFSEVQAKRKLKAKTARAAAAKSREALLSQKAASAASMRADKAALTEAHKTKMQEAYLANANAVKAVIADSIFSDSDATGGSLGKPVSPAAAGGDES
jgi:hypothetical protein